MTRSVATPIMQAAARDLAGCSGSANSASRPEREEEMACPACRDTGVGG
jgi:hypothetical protein